MFIRIMLQESGGNPLAVGDVDRPVKGCRSRGLFQIHNCSWPDVSDECAFDVQCSINWAADRFKEGRIEIWTTWLVK